MSGDERVSNPCLHNFNEAISDHELHVTALDSDEALAKIARHEREAFIYLYQRYVDRIYSYLAWKIGRQPAEDVTADVFVCALEGIHRFQPDRSFKAWLFGIARHQVSGYMRKSRNRDLPCHADTGEADDPEQLSLQAEQRALARSLVARLPEQHREVMELRYWGELSIRDVAQIVGKREGTVKVMIHRILKSMKDQLEVTG
jgi:RNA polymerase sigma-70 factor (ECF subfamily)